MAIGVWRNRQCQNQYIYNQDDERLIAKTPYPPGVAMTVIWNQVTKSEAELVIKKS